MAHVHPIAAAWAALLPAGVVARPALPNNLQLPTKADLGRANKYYNQVQMYALSGALPGVTDDQLGAASAYAMAVYNARANAEAPANPAMAPAIIAALTDPAVIAALAAAMGPAITAAVNAAVGPAVNAAVGPAVNAAVGPAVNAAVGPAVDAALVPLETRIARAYNRSSLSQSDASAPLMPLPQPITGAVPNDFPATKHDFDVLSQPPLTHNKLKKSYRLLHFYRVLNGTVPFPAAPPPLECEPLKAEIGRVRDILRAHIA